MPTDLTSWVPKKILDISADERGYIITEEDWNGRWNKNREQGDDTAQRLYEAVQNLYETVWHATNGAALIKHPVLHDEYGDDSLDDVSSQIAWLAARAALVLPLSSDTGAEYLRNTGFTDYANADTVAEQIAALFTDVQSRRKSSDAIAHSDLDGNDQADCHPISAITNLQSTLNAMVAGELSAIDHNLLPSRNAADAHPISAITDLQDALTTINTNHSNLDTLHDTLRTEYNAHKGGTADKHASSAIVHGAGTVASKIAAMDATIAALTGDMSEIVHNDLAGRTTAGAHTIAAITNLQTTIDTINTNIGLKLATATAASTYQRKVLHGTAVPGAGLGVDGDIYIKHA